MGDADDLIVAVRALVARMDGFNRTVSLALAALAEERPPPKPVVSWWTRLALLLSLVAVLSSASSLLVLRSVSDRSTTVLSKADMALVASAAQQASNQRYLNETKQQMEHCVENDISAALDGTPRDKECAP